MNIIFLNFECGNHTQRWWYTFNIIHNFFGIVCFGSLVSRISHIAQCGYYQCAHSGRKNIEYWKWVRFKWKRIKTKGNWFSLLLCTKKYDTMYKSVSFWFHFIHCDSFLSFGIRLNDILFFAKLTPPNGTGSYEPF